MFMFTPNREMSLSKDWDAARVAFEEALRESYRTALQFQHVADQKERAAKRQSPAPATSLVPVQWIERDRRGNIIHQRPGLRRPQAMFPVPVPILLQYHAPAPIPTRFRLPDAGPTGADGEFHGARLSRNPKGDLGREADKSWGKGLRQWWTACSLLKNVKRLKETTSLLEEKRAELDINHAVIQEWVAEVQQWPEATLQDSQTGQTRHLQKKTEGLDSVRQRKHYLYRWTGKPQQQYDLKHIINQAVKLICERKCISHAHQTMLMIKCRHDLCYQLI
ncbi:uncharacterized protein LOC115107375 [Oncorhynchus nerka]|uniref:uncharacterized protein LOC115107375 n=1 Tax=Oncorhynchus nerka TaxID=8023 RepID=UPI00112FEE6D|nr:uncharacterized protein LOC115107375 [Oncorhynchus nerka]